MSGEDLGQLGNECLTGDRALDQVQQRFAGVFVDHRGDLDGLAIDGGVELEIDRPHHARRVSEERQHRRDSRPLARGHDLDLQALFTPEPVDLLLVDLTALVVAQRRPGTPEPVTGVFGGVC